MNKDVLRGIMYSIVTLILLGFVFAVGYHSANEIQSGIFTGEYNFTGEVYGIVPSGQISAFYLASCPLGWKAADGSNGTPDLRGQFIRGLNNFGTGIRVDGNQDPDSRNLGDFQSDELKSHSHSGVPSRLENNAYSGHLSQVGDRLSEWSLASYTTSTGGSETRPKNIALIYCMKN